MHKALDLFKFGEGRSNVDVARHLFGAIGFARPANPLALRSLNLIVVFIRTTRAEEMLAVGNDRGFFDDLLAIDTGEYLDDRLNKPAWFMERIVGNRKG